LRVKIDDLSEKFFRKDERMTVNAEVSSKNLKSSYGQVDIIFDEAVKLKLKHISWQKNKCQSRECETPLLEDGMRIFSKEGIYLGDLFAKDSSDYFGNVVVSYDVVAAQKDIKIHSGDIQHMILHSDGSVESLGVTKFR